MSNHDSRNQAAAWIVLFPNSQDFILMALHHHQFPDFPVNPWT